MVRFGVFIFVVLAIYSVYVDMTKGTLPVSHSVSTKPVAQQAAEFYTKTVEPGETVLSIIEHHEGRLPTSIETIVIDFETLNHGLSPENVIIGHTYKFREYN